MSFHLAIIQNKLKITWRTMSGNQSPLVRVLTIGSIFVACHLFGYFLYTNFMQLPANQIASKGPRVLGITFVVIFVWMLFTALRKCADLLGNKKELELYLTSPLSPQAIFSGNFAAVVVHAASLFILVFLPFANVAVFFGDFKWLGMYASVLSMAVVASALALAFCGLLFKYFGASASKTIINVLVAGITILSFLSLMMTSPAASSVVDSGYADKWAMLSQPGELLGPQSNIWLYGQASMSHGYALASVLVIAVIVYGTALRLLTPIYYHSLIDEASSSHAKNVDISSGWDTGLFGIFFIKEWRAIGREPKLVLDILFQIVILVAPMLLITLQIAIGRGDIAMHLFPVVTVFVGCMAGVFSWITLSGEECTVLLQCAPNDVKKINQIKLVCVLLPLWATVLLLSMIAVAAQPYAGLVLFVTAMASTIHIGITNSWLALPSKRLDLNKRGTNSDATARIIEFVLVIAWGAVTYGAIFDWVIFSSAVAVITVVASVAFKLKHVQTI